MARFGASGGGSSAVLLHIKETTHAPPNGPRAAKPRPRTDAGSRAIRRSAAVSFVRSILRQEHQRNDSGRIVRDKKPGGSEAKGSFCRRPPQVTAPLAPQSDAQETAIITARPGKGS